MKYCFLYLCLFSTCFSFGQNLLDSTVVWYEFHNYTSTGNALSHSYTKREVIGDTLIAGNQYFILQSTTLDSFVNYMQGGTVFVNLYTNYSYWREENQAFYRYLTYTFNNTTISEDQLWYNFDLQIGSLFDSTDMSCVVNYIDTLYLGNAPLRRYSRDSITNSFNDIFSVLIEGIGPLVGFEQHAQGCWGIPIGEEHHLCCYSRGGQTISFSDTYTWLPQLCNMSVTSEKPNPPISFVIFPNPAQEKLSILTEKAYENGKIRLVNILGNPVIETEIQGKSSVLDLKNLSKGMYFLSIEVPNHLLLTRKIEIQ